MLFNTLGYFLFAFLSRAIFKTHGDFEIYVGIASGVRQNLTNTNDVIYNNYV